MPSATAPQASSRQRGALLVLLSAVLFAVGVAIVHGIVLALEPPPPPSPPPWSDPGSPTAEIAIFSLMGGGVALVAAALGALAVTPTALRLVPLACAAGAAFVVVRALGWDPYYGYAQRFIDNGAISSLWLLATGFVALTSPFAIRAAPRAGLVSCALLLWFCASASVLVMAGH